MARELASRDRDDGRERSSLGRRGYLTLCSTVASAGALIGFSGLATATDRPAETPERSEDAHTLVVEGTGDYSSFEVTVSDSISPLAAADALSTTGTTGPAAEGVVGGNARGYRFTGDITDVRVDGRVALYVDGVRVSYEAV